MIVDIMPILLVSVVRRTDPNNAYIAPSEIMAELKFIRPDCGKG